MAEDEFSVNLLIQIGRRSLAATRLTLPRSWKDLSIDHMLDRIEQLLSLWQFNVRIVQDGGQKSVNFFT